MYEIKIKKIIEEVTGLKEAKLTVPPPSFKGDLSTNAAMTAGMDPRKLSRALLSMKEVDEVTTAGPGFVNIILKPEAYCNELSQILAGAENYGSATGKGTVLFEMVSSNPTGPLHIGHGRGAAIGDSMARIFNKTGYDVYREYYVNDSGNQMRLLGESVSRVSRGLKQPEEGYRGAYIEEIAENLPPSDDIAAAAGEKILRGHIKVLEKFKVKYDSFVRESHFDKTGSINNHIDKMKKRNLTYLKKGALWFKSTRFGDDSDRVRKKRRVIHLLCR